MVFRLALCAAARDDWIDNPVDLAHGLAKGMALGRDHPARQYSLPAPELLLEVRHRDLDDACDALAALPQGVRIPRDALGRQWRRGEPSLLLPELAFARQKPLTHQRHELASALILDALTVLSHEHGFDLRRIAEHV